LERLGFLTSANLDQAFETWDVAACIVASDTSRHLMDCLETLSHGVPCLVEKPISRNEDEARQLHLKALASSGRLYVGCVMRFSDSIRQLRASLDRAGQIHSVRIECQSYLPDWRPGRPYRESYSARQEEGGVLRDLIHEVDYAGWLFGWPASLHAQLNNTGTLEIEAEETADLLWRTSAGASVSTRLDYLTRPTRRHMTVCGERGSLLLDLVRQSVMFQGADGAADESVATQTGDEMFAAQARAFLRCAAGEEDDRLASGLDGVRAMAVCDAARRADRAGREELVMYP
jgi:predicted dehydrogenase